MKPRHWWMIAGAAALFGLIAALLIFPAGSGPWTSKPPARSKNLLRIASFNVEGLYDPDNDPGLSGKHDDVPSSQAHLDAISAAILAVDADILALQDVESLAAVEWFNQTYLSSLGYEHVAAIDVGHIRGAENAVLSRYPITGNWVWPDLQLGGKHPSSIGGKPNRFAGKPIAFNRSPLMVDIEIPGGATLTLMVVEHKGGNNYDYWREAEANVIAEICSQAGLNRRTIILGSFHSDPNSPSLQPYFDAGFSDPFSTKKGSEFYATETTGDRTDFILANRAVGRDLDQKTGFVLGGDLAESILAGDGEMTHLPVVIGLRIEP